MLTWLTRGIIRLVELTVMVLLAVVGVVFMLASGAVSVTRAFGSLLHKPATAR